MKDPGPWVVRLIECFTLLSQVWAAATLALLPGKEDEVVLWEEGSFIVCLTCSVPHAQSLVHYFLFCTWRILQTGKRLSGVWIEQGGYHG